MTLNIMLKNSPSVWDIYEQENYTGASSVNENLTHRSRVPQTYKASKTLVLYSPQSGHRAFAVVRNPQTAMVQSQWDITLIARHERIGTEMMSFSIGSKVFVDNENFTVVGVDGGRVLSEQEATDFLRSELERKQALVKPQAQHTSQKELRQSQHFTKMKQEEVKRQAESLRESNEWMAKWREDREQKQREDEERKLREDTERITQKPIQTTIAPPGSTPTSSAGTGCVLILMSFVACVTIMSIFLRH